MLMDPWDYWLTKREPILDVDGPVMSLESILDVDGPVMSLDAGYVSRSSAANSKSASGNLKMQRHFYIVGCYQADDVKADKSISCLHNKITRKDLVSIQRSNFSKCKFF